MTNEKSILKLYIQLLEEARNRDAMLVQQFSIFTAVISFVLLAIVTIFTKDSICLINSDILLGSLFFLGFILFFTVSISLQKVGHSRDLTWKEAENLEKNNQIPIKIVKIIKGQPVLKFPLTYLVDIVPIWSWLFIIISFIMLYLSIIFIVNTSFLLSFTLSIIIFSLVILLLSKKFWKKYYILKKKLNRN